MTEKVVIGLSGGVDSAVSALLLKQAGYDVSAVFMRNWQEDDEHCPATEDLNDAKAVCARLNIPFHSVSFAELYWDKVFAYFLDEYQAGRTPNPDILCNKEIKFRAFLDYAVNELNADKIATGHYVSLRQEQDIWQLHKAADSNKDQSYFLYTLQQEQLRNSIFPLANITKPKVRELAKHYNFINHAKKDSTGICFIGERKFRDFLKQYLLAMPGDICDENDKPLARHQGLMFYTLGQRQGLGIGGTKMGGDAPWYVLDKDIPNNKLIVGQGHDHPRLYKNNLTCSQCHWISGQPPQLPGCYQAKIRYRQADQSCHLSVLPDGNLHVDFEQAQRAITPGQSIVFYQDTQCLGGGIIQ